MVSADELFGVILGEGIVDVDPTVQTDPSLYPDPKDGKSKVPHSTQVPHCHSSLHCSSTWPSLLRSWSTFFLPTSRCFLIVFSDSRRAGRTPWHQASQRSARQQVSRSQSIDPRADSEEYDNIVKALPPTQLLVIGKLPPLTTRQDADRSDFHAVRLLIKDRPSELTNRSGAVRVMPLHLF